MGHKSVDSSFYGYKTHLAMSERTYYYRSHCNLKRKGDDPLLTERLENSQQNGIDVDTVIGDAAYSGKSILKLTNEQGIKVVAKLNPSITQGFRKKRISI